MEVELLSTLLLDFDSTQLWLSLEGSDNRLFSKRSFPSRTLKIQVLRNILLQSKFSVLNLFLENILLFFFLPWF